MSDIAIRAFKTFYQTALSYILATSGGVINIQDNNALAGLIISAIAAGISAVVNLGLKNFKFFNANKEE